MSDWCAPVGVLSEAAGRHLLSKTVSLALVACLVGMPAFADPPPDAPLEDMPGVSVRLRPGEPAPFQGQLLSEPEQIRRGKRLADAEATLAKAEQSVLLPKAAVVGIIVGALVLGAAAGAGVAVAVRR